MSRIFGAILIIGISTLAGFFFSQKYSERCRLLKIWLQIIDIFQTEICFQAHRLPEVFQRAASSLDDRYFYEAFGRLALALEFGTSEDFGGAWRRFVAETGMQILTKNDCQVLNELGNYLGGTDRQDQLAKLKICRATLAMNLQTAESERNKQTGIYRYLGFATGAIVVLLLI